MTNQSESIIDQFKSTTNVRLINLNNWKSAPPRRYHPDKGLQSYPSRTKLLMVVLEKFILRLSPITQATGGSTVRWDVAVEAEP
jgi:hypothetical protein